LNKETGGGKKRGSGRAKKVNRAPSRKGGRLGGRDSSAAPRRSALAPGEKSGGDRRATRVPLM
jgi:hypothetical protein